MGENRDVINTGRVYLRALEAAQAGNAIVAGLNLNEADAARFNRRLDAAATRLRSYGVAGIISANTVEYDDVALDIAAEFELTPEQLAQVINGRNGLERARSGFEEALKDHDSIQNEALVPSVIAAMERVSAGYRFNSENQIDQGVRAALNHLNVSRQPFGDRTFTIANQGLGGDSYKMPRHINTPPVQAPRTPTQPIEGSVPNLVSGASSLYAFYRENPTGTPGEGVWLGAFTEAQRLGLTREETQAFAARIKALAIEDGAPATLTQEALVAALNDTKAGFGTQHQAAIVTAMAAPAGPAVEPTTRGRTRTAPISEVAAGEHDKNNDANTRLGHLRNLVDGNSSNDVAALTALNALPEGATGYLSTEASVRLVAAVNAVVTPEMLRGGISPEELQAIDAAIRDAGITAADFNVSGTSGGAEAARAQLTALSRNLADAANRGAAPS